MSLLETTTTFVRPVELRESVSSISSSSIPVTVQDQVLPYPRRGSLIRTNYTAYNEIPMKGNTMFTKKPSENKTGVTEAINSLLKEMESLNGDSEQYAQMNDQLTKLYALKEIDNKIDTPRRVSMDTLAIVGGNLLGIFTIVIYEQKSVLTSKALGLLTKLK
jgi:hypothetical protein